ncbi:MAG TPA: Asp-tRNA(Asn)/Glu-tRNA(Gln) amidotransferase subunit GatC [Victivallales bacterium]|nr:Asp-tRNA(Asn)/Glu-tRNA(Gln) amidotransferase subunit GatC [Victivallales bacterium]HPO91135.1 Asp-tRNA(Asn)/Glu-tRNA(Gln) amidotransferase subunit GatC [Victivallales bacterium]HRR29431.1 Asp-tRNA(Asn)/Glu-tRNA(Gln) amidotransferase subunit GatC [Victivallales bacterium]
MKENKIFNIDDIAALAKLKIAESDKKKLMNDMMEIVGYIEELSKLKLSNIEPMHHSSNIQNISREDIVKAPFPREKILSIAPDTFDELIKVPAILPDEEQ